MKIRVIRYVFNYIINIFKYNGFKSSFINTGETSLKLILKRGGISFK